MSQPTTDELLQAFTGAAPLFPLPGTVFFPNVMLPLHVFEDRYRAMVADAVDGDRLIAVALLKPDHEPLYDTKHAPIHETVCLGRITAEERLDDGRYHLLLRGLSRARLLDEPESANPYRIGRLELLEDVIPDPPAFDREVRRAELLWAFRHAVGRGLDQALHAAADASIPLGFLCDVIAAALDVPAADRQSVLELADVDARSGRLLEVLHALGLDRPTRDFPPAFSVN